MEASKLGIKRIILPKENAKEAAIVQNIEVIGIDNLKELIKYLNDEIKIEKEEIQLENIFGKAEEYQMNFCNVKGQKNVKRALEVAAAGGHNCILIGSPRLTVRQ